MNLYIRYFNHETLAHDLDESLAFLEGIGEFAVNKTVAEKIMNFIESSSMFPMRLKVSYSNYVLFLKTEADTLERFHELEVLNKEAKAEAKQTLAERKQSILNALNEPRPGWYETSVLFKRVVMIPETQKCQYVDTTFVANVKADSVMDAYDRTISHLQSRGDVDSRSQFPSVRSDAFTYKFLCEC